MKKRVIGCRNCPAQTGLSGPFLLASSEVSSLLKQVVRERHPLAPLGIVELSLFRLAAEIEIVVETLFVCSDFAPEGLPNLLGYRKQWRLGGFIGEHDSEEHRRIASPIVFPAVSGAYNFTFERLL